MLEFKENVLESIMADREPDNKSECVQRPSAVANMRVREWKRREKERNVMILRVHDHKTSAKGPALLLLTAEREAALDQYHRLVRPLVAKHPENRGCFYSSAEEG